MSATMPRTTSTTPSAPATQRRLHVVPGYVIVLLFAVAAGWWLTLQVAPHLRAAAAGTPLDSDAGRNVVFAATFNAIVGAGLALAWLLELIGSIARLLRGRQAARTLLRLIVTSLPLAIFAFGQWLLAPEALQLALEALR